VSLPEIIGGKYRPRRVLGAGSTGTVYSVEHTLTGEVLALKVMTSHLGGSPEAVARFKREALVVSKIRSQHVVRIFDADVAPELNGAPYLVMDLLEGVDLEQLSDEKPVEPVVVVNWLRQVADPLDQAHRIGIIHRDLKPENLFLTRDEDGSPLIKILDFGIARIATESMSIGTTQWGQLLGTPLYMAPEQARGDPTQVCPSTDLYALGLIAYKLLAGTSYRTGTTLTVMLEEIVRGPLRTPSEVRPDFSPEFDCWFLRACHADPGRRFASAEQQVEALARALDLPTLPEAVASPSSGLGTRQSFTRDLHGSLSGAGESARISHNVLIAAEVKAASTSERAGMTVPSPLGATFDVGRPRRNGWRVAFFAAAAVVVILLLTLAMPRPKASAVAALGPAPTVLDQAPPAEPRAIPSPSADPSPAANSIESLAATTLAAPAKVAPVVGAARAPQREAPRAVLPLRPMPVHTWAPARPRASADDDPLSDQQ
jgi:serine/threonine protein kinase